MNWANDTHTPMEPSRRLIDPANSQLREWAVEKSGLNLAKRISAKQAEAYLFFDQYNLKGAMTSERWYRVSIKRIPQ